jgi:hypothetical protein
VYSIRNCRTPKPLKRLFVTRAPKASRYARHLRIGEPFHAVLPRVGWKACLALGCWPAEVEGRGWAVLQGAPWEACRRGSKAQLAPVSYLAPGGGFTANLFPLSRLCGSPQEGCAPRGSTSGPSPAKLFWSWDEVAPALGGMGCVDSGGGRGRIGFGSLRSCCGIRRGARGAGYEPSLS